ncbi:hypothetical protein QL926_18480 [Pseudoalteromonas sp. APC 3213]|jgi:uncharacterized phage infection (PIP) family protein YhgE|uniref:hypothetical protein n=1 Tax=Pseudoalteromonas sp. APC 3213 TaxID=3035178 RepID=UPI0025B5FB4A|nr:hypothetical protein [Pseudoalteromonas sp. APC 3213]MDN3403428.1 hypothetical protein [Pseudoalteromonas sp. APC 3213]
MSALDNYYSALERLVSNQPQVLEVGKYKINQDSVCLEAGVGKGSIKPSRGQGFKILASDIKNAAKQHINKSTEKQKLDKKLQRNKNKAEKFEKLLYDSLNRELMLINRVYELECRLSALEENIIKPIR